eukprot:jgi/Tetstr1/426503/TSEL_016802.t1
MPTEAAVAPRVAIVPSCLGGGPVMSVQLAHPGSGAPAAFLLGAGGSVAEVQVYRKTYAAWLTGQASVADGGLWLASRLDPLLLLLPALETMRAATSERPDGMFVELPSGLLDLPGGAALAELVPPLLGAGGKLECVCEKKEVGGHVYYRLHEGRLAAWLDLKVEATKAGIRSSSAVAMSCLEGPDLEVYAVGLLAEYLSPGRASALAERRGAARAAAPAAADELPTGSRWVALAERDENNADVTQANKRPRIDPAELAKQRAKERAKVVKAEAKSAQVKRETRGMASISSFFKKK